MSSEEILEKKQHDENESLDEEYNLNCCIVCGHHLEFVKMYPATCGMCKKTNHFPEKELPINYEALSDFRVLDSNNGRL